VDGGSGSGGVCGTANTAVSQGKYFASAYEFELVPKLKKIQKFKIVTARNDEILKKMQCVQ
jgi:hypothetical protein